MGTIPPFAWISALLFSAVAGGVVTGILMWVSDRVLKWNERNWFTSIIVGATERIAITVIFIAAPQTLLLFLGGWTVAKFANGWDRVADNNSGTVRARRLMALVGTLWSYAIAIGTGYWMHSASLSLVAH